MINKVVIAALAAAVATSPAMAASFDLGTIASNGYSFSPGLVTTSGSTTDYTFKLSSRSNVNLGLTNQKLAPLFDAASLQLSLYQGASLLGGYTVGSNSLNSKIFSGLTAASPYTIQVSGTGTGFAGGLYFLSLAATAAPVPGPTGWLVGAAGLGVIGYGMRRKNKAAATA